MSSPLVEIFILPAGKHLVVLGETDVVSISSTKDAVNGLTGDLAVEGLGVPLENLLGDRGEETGVVIPGSLVGLVPFGGVDVVTIETESARHVFFLVFR